MTVRADFVKKPVVLVTALDDERVDDRINILDIGVRLRVQLIERIEMRSALPQTAERIQDINRLSHAAARFRRHRSTGP